MPGVQEVFTWGCPAGLPESQDRGGTPETLDDKASEQELSGVEKKCSLHALTGSMLVAECCTHAKHNHI